MTKMDTTPKDMTVSDTAALVMTIRGATVRGMTQLGTIAKVSTVSGSMLMDTTVRASTLTGMTALAETNAATIVMEDALRMIVHHSEGADDSDDRMLVNLKICEHKHLLDDNEFLDRLHGVRRICNANGHELDAEETMSHNKVHFVVMQIRDLLDSAEKTLVTVQYGGKHNGKNKRRKKLTQEAGRRNSGRNGRR